MAPVIACMTHSTPGGRDCVASVRLGRAALSPACDSAQPEGFEVSISTAYRLGDPYIVRNSCMRAPTAWC
eukprot:4364113-Pleurochrysis_carterae.AAC.10